MTAPDENKPPEPTAPPPSDASPRSTDIPAQPLPPGDTPLHLRHVHSRAKRRSWWILIALVTLLGGADQWLKRWANTTLRDRHGGQLVVLEGSSASAALTFVRNPGAAWGLMAKTSERFRRPFFVLVSLLAMAFILYLFAKLRAGQTFLAIALASIYAGALGNFVDRLHLGFVVDFIDIRVGRIRWPTFNIADVAIVVGVTMIFGEMLVATLRERRRRRNTEEPPQPQG